RPSAAVLSAKNADAEHRLCREASRVGVKCAISDPHPTAFALLGSRPPPFRGRLPTAPQCRMRCARDTHAMTYIGRSVPRLEDRPLVTGAGRFAADIAFPHMLHMRVVRASHAHGHLRAIDAAAALALPGVPAVWTEKDVRDIPPIDFRLTRVEGLAPYRQPILAHNKVRYVGEPVAAVFAADPYLAEDAADLIALDIDELPVILDAAAEPGTFGDGRTTEAALIEKSYGDVDASFRDAHAVIALDLSIGRHSGVPLETRGAIA